MNYSNIIQELEEASLFDLYRLSSAIQEEMQNTTKIKEIKNSLRVGQIITWFDTQTHNLVKAEILKFNKNRCVVKNIVDEKVWDLIYPSINTHNVEVDIHSNQEFGLKKSELKVGDIVSFLDNKNELIYGKVIKLNPKTAGINIDGQNWRVSYNLLNLAKDLDGEIVPDDLVLDFKLS